MRRQAVVMDSSVHIDLEHGALLDAVLALNIEFNVPYYQYLAEFVPYSGEKIVEMGLNVLQPD